MSGHSNMNFSNNLGVVETGIVTPSLLRFVIVSLLEKVCSLQLPDAKKMHIAIKENA